MEDIFMDLLRQIVSFSLYGKLNSANNFISFFLIRKVKRTDLKQHGWVFFYMCVLSGLDIKGGMVAADSSRFNTVEEYTACYFSTHSRELLVQV